MPASPRDLPVWALAAASLRAGTPATLLCVLRREGSSPGRQGFKMSVTPADSAGSIGGGIMEHKFVELARQRLHADGFPAEAIARLRGPIGLPIHSQTPEEIAISIAAELIQVRHAALDELMSNENEQ